VSVVSSSQLDLLGVPTKKTKIEKGKPVFQTSLREKFLRKANEGEGRQASIAEELELLTPEQVESALAEVGQEEEEEDREENEHVDEGEEDEDEEMEDVETDDVEMEDVPMESVEDDIEDEEEEEQAEQEVEQTPVEKPKPSPSKSIRTLLRPRVKNAVHNLRTQTTLSLSTLHAQHTALQTHLPTHPSRPLEPAKEYTEPTEKAEERLSLTVAKEDFARMRIVGQFNLGFIIAVRDKEGQEGEDVFIIDQHASDEKFNFERLQAETVMQVQALAR
jgi:DNA mismatch repair protein PMS2